jgi:hypothetical protein
VDVRLAREGILEVLVAADVREDAQLDLRVVRGEQRDVRRPGDERPPDAPAERRPDRDVLEVRVARRQPPGGRDGLVERRVQPPVRGDQRRQRLDVGRAELRVDPPLEQLVDHRVGGAELLEDRRVRRVAGLRPLALRQVELEEQDLLELLGAAEVELVSDVDVDLPLQALDLGAELAVEDRECVAVHGDAVGLHPRQDGNERQLDLAEQPVELHVGEAPLERLAHGERRQRLEPRPRRGRQLRGGRQDLVQLLGDDVRDRLAAQRRVEHVGRDLGVERHGRG